MAAPVYNPDTEEAESGGSLWLLRLPEAPLEFLGLPEAPLGSLTLPGHTHTLLIIDHSYSSLLT